MSENQDQKSKKLWWYMSKKQPWPKKRRDIFKKCLSEKNKKELQLKKKQHLSKPSVSQKT